MRHRLDRISSLPDEVICHILSFLPTETSVSTSILSKRWSPLWRSVPTLDLDDERTRGDDSYLRFAVFVYSFLLFRDAIHPIKSCTIKSPYDVFFNFNNVNKWLRVVLQLGGVEHLDLDFEIEEEYKLLYKLPSSILNCTTLVVLKLCVSEVNDVSSVQLPSLKIMDLECVEFARHGYLSDLLSGCPNLEDFKATDVSVLSEHEHDDRLGEFKSLTKLISACFYQSYVKFSLELIRNVEYLDLYVDEEVFSDYKHIPTFGNLTHLRLDFRNYYSWQLLLEMLKQCPMLQILVLFQRVEEPEHEEEDWVSPEPTPECISSKLRECTIGNCEGKKGELQFARYIMHDARVLKMMKIDCFCRSRVKFEVKKEISSYKKSSAMCQLLFNF